MNHIEMMQLAEHVAKQSVCPDRQVGAVLVSGTGGWVATPNDKKANESNLHHAEAKLVTMIGSPSYFYGATLYVTCRPCVRCTEMLLPLGLKAVYYRDEQPEMDHLQQLRDAGVLVDGSWIQGQVQESWAERWPRKSTEESM